MKNSISSLFVGIALTSFSPALLATNSIVVFQSDFGLNDGAVSAMKGVSMSVDNTLKLFDLTHEIPAYNVWDAAYRLYQTAEYWPSGTVFVSIVDPGVGTNRASVVLKTKSGHYFVTPDNGTLTLVAEKFGIDEIREIDEAVNRRQDSEKSYTFHGRDIYTYTAAKLAAQKITFENVGRARPNDIFQLPYQKATLSQNTLFGTIPILDVQYGNVWTNIGRDTAAPLNIKQGDLFTVQIYNKEALIFEEKMAFANSFGEVKEGDNLLYYNSLDNLSLAVNMSDFAKKYNIQHGSNWTIKIHSTH